MLGDLTLDKSQGLLNTIELTSQRSNHVFAIDENLLSSHINLHYLRLNENWLKVNLLHLIEEGKIYRY